MKTVLVIGGGVTGLSAMYELNKWKKENLSNIRLVLAESSAQLGGKIRTVREGSFVMEAGADSIVARKANEMNFIQDLGLEEELVYNTAGRSYIYSDGKLKLIPADSVFGIPASVESLAKTTLVSAEGKVAALKDFYTKNEGFTKNDSIGEFLEHFFGKELVEKQIAPVLSGVYSGELSDLTIASTLPQVFDYKEKYGSIIKGIEENRKAFQSGGEKKFLSFKSGLDALIHAYEEKLEGAEILKNTQAAKIEKANGRYRVTFTNGESMDTDHVVLSIPHNAAEVLIKDRALEREFSGLKNSSLISIYVAFDIPDSQLPADGTGFITANTDELTCNACTWTSRKWKHTSESGNLLIRLFYKSSHPVFTSLKEMNEEELLQVALADIKKSLGIVAEPAASEVTNWTEKMPNYLITHPKTVAALERRLAEDYPGVWLAGCSYYGVGIPDCIENGANTARKIIQNI
ncbi:oxygen-dependent protoporphyrinogen oxidase [Cytobacillus oceanisediminis]|uniref:Coproporphyrinogen III oxidase n=1 Tax=Cytobacillus oceanisediminis TaxID=665099 RepID=A0A2V2ZMF6_9BACI|nr:protoporphyrinogen oxidase [Cytobacillus oceanisediminis]PWW25487.1 oxygen-dependent protoporphyrinogen oxidase [Cytobacillus oceanisediminis]